MLQLECLPTLAVWDDGALGDSLSYSLERCHNEEEVTTLVRNWLAAKN